MISIQKEKKIRELLRTGLSDREIGRSSGVEHHVVAKMRRAIDEAHCVSEEKSQDIRWLLKHGMSVKAIELRTGVTENAIKAIRRTYYLQRRESDGSDVAMCPTCGAVMLPKVVPVKDEPEEVVTSESRGLLQVVEDLVQLQRMNVIYHPLFYSLACRAEEALNRNERG
jgi:hypothetical protein